MTEHIRIGAIVDRSTLTPIEHRIDDFFDPWRAAEVETVVLHPGLGGNVRLYKQWVPILADRYRVLRVTARGQGGTPRPPDYQWSLDGFVDDVMDVLDTHDIQQIHWVGASGGGVIGQAAAIAYPERIRSLSLVATTARFQGPPGDYDEWLAPLDEGNHREFLERDIDRRFGTENPARTQWIIDELCRTDGQTSAELHRWVRNVNLVPKLGKIDCPTLIITGEHDILTSLGDAAILKEGIRDSQVEIMPDLPHNIAYTHPTDVARIVRRFLDTQSVHSKE